MLNAMTPLRRGMALNTLLGMKPAEAHKQAGGTCNNEDQRYDLGMQILSNPSVKTFLESVNEDIADETKVDSAYVLKRLQDMQELDILDIMDEDGSLKPLSEWPKVWRISISAMDLMEMAQSAGDPEASAAVIKKIKWPDKTKNLELIGKHKAVNAFKETVEVDHKGVVFNMNFGDKDA